MKTFVSMVVVILIFTLFAVQNTAIVPIKLFAFAFTVPLSLAIVVPLAIALLFLSLFHFGISRKSILVIRNLEDTAENAQKELLAATKRSHELEIENRKLKIRLGDETEADERSL